MTWLLQSIQILNSMASRYASTVSSDAVPTGPRECPIADALTLVGDRWALLALRGLGLGVSLFNDTQRTPGAPRGSLSARLRSLEAAGLVTRHRYSDRP